MATRRDGVMMQYADFDEIKEIGSGGYGTVYTAKYKYEYHSLVVLKRFKSYYQTPELFINEVSVLDIIIN